MERQIVILKIAVCILAAALLGACRGGGGGDDNIVTGPKTTSEIVTEEIAQNTSDSSEPIMLNDLAISDADTTEAAVPFTVQ